MRLLLVLAVGLSPVGMVMCWFGARGLREQWALSRRGVRVPAVAERWESKAGAFGVYRFLDGDVRTRVANAERLRTAPAVETEIVYDPVNPALVRERFWFAEVLIAVLTLATGLVVTVSGVATLVLAVIVFA